MAKGKDSKEYCTQWKNEVSGILYGPVADVYMHKDLAQRMRDSIATLCSQIDEVGVTLVKEGTFSK